nr:S8 family serine peptidase [Pseudarthrobacter sp. NamE2]
MPAVGQPPSPPVDVRPEALSRSLPLGFDPEDRFIVKFEATSHGKKPSRTERGNAYRQAARKLGIGVHEVREANGNLAVVRSATQLSDIEAKRFIAELAVSPGVEYAEIDTFFRPATTPDDPLYQLQWDLFEDRGGIRAPGAWSRSNGSGQIVAVIDSGITAHSDLTERTVPGFDFITDPAMAHDDDGRDDNPQDEGDWCGSTSSSWHGTHVTGTVAAGTNNGVGIAGVAYGAKVQPIRAMGSCGGYMSDIADAVTWAVGGTVTGVPANPTPARVVNLSIGATATCSTTLQNVMTYAATKGAAVVVAAGNEAQPVANSAPANCNNVISVGATDREGARAPYSNHGPGLDISAPGGSMDSHGSNGIASTWNSGTTTPGLESYAYLQGTSMAAPHVAGVAALMLAADPTLTPGQIETTLKSTARPVPAGCSTDECGAGIVDANAALDALPLSSPTPAPAPQTLTTGTPALAPTAAIGQTLSADEGSWAPTPVTFSYQWTRNGTAIPLATNRDYTVRQVDLAQEIAVIITGSKPGYTPASISSPPATIRPFTDVENSHVFHKEIAWLASNGISNGWNETDGTKTYRPTIAVSRDVMAAFMYRLAGSPAYSPPANSPFTDVATSHVFYKEIAWLASNGISNGWNETDGTKTYRPIIAVSRDVMAAFMYRFATTAARS